MPAVSEKMRVRIDFPPDYEGVIFKIFENIYNQEETGGARASKKR